MKERYLTLPVLNDLKQKMVFISGPRQVGKTTLAQYLGGRFFKPFTYLNWDFQPDRKKIIKGELPAGGKLVIFDELHKYRQWKNYIKGIFDQHRQDFSILVTGSARLDIYRKGGDSLANRYFHYTLHPFSLAELLEIPPTKAAKPFQQLNFAGSPKTEIIFKRLWQYGPFPEPYLKHSPVHLRRWQMAKNDRLIKEEIRDLTAVADLSALQILVEILPGRVGSPLSINNLREDLQAAHKTAANYLKILELFYFHFRLYPFAKKPLRSLTKMAKLYLWDWSVIPDGGARLENLVASHLLKFADWLKNNQGFNARLHYLKDSEGREVDFLITIDDQPWLAVETKLTPEKSYLNYYRQRLKIPHVYQVVKTPGVDSFHKEIRVISAAKFLTALV